MKKENSMKFKRFFALALAALLVMSLFAGCSKNSDTPGDKTDSSGSLIDQTKPAATTAKYLSLIHILHGG